MTAAFSSGGLTPEGPKYVLPQPAKDQQIPAVAAVLRRVETGAPSAFFSAPARGRKVPSHETLGSGWSRNWPGWPLLSTKGNKSWAIEIRVVERRKNQRKRKSSRRARRRDQRQCT